MSPMFEDLFEASEPQDDGLLIDVLRKLTTNHKTGHDELSHGNWARGISKKYFEERVVGAIESRNLDEPERYKAAFKKLLNIMPEEAVKDALEGTQDIKFFNNLNDLVATLAKDAGKEIPDGVAGAYNSTTDVLYLDGNSFDLSHFTGNPLEVTGKVFDLYAHEIVHAMDHDSVVAKSYQWGRAYFNEMFNDQLTQYASSSPTEALAEFGRIIYTKTSPIQQAVIQREFPIAYEVFEIEGWLPDLEAPVNSKLKDEILSVKEKEQLEAMATNAKGPRFEDIFVVAEQPDGIFIDVLKPELTGNHLKGTKFEHADDQGTHGNRVGENELEKRNDLLFKNKIVPAIMRSDPQDALLYKDVMWTLLKTMPEMAAHYASRGIKDAHFWDSAAEMREGIARISNIPIEKIPLDIGGGYNPNTNELYLDGSMRPNQHARPGAFKSRRRTLDIYAHEMTHAMDEGWVISSASGVSRGLFSDTYEWSEIWKEEISKGQLTTYATTNRSEGMAEFGRVLYTMEPRATKLIFPKAYAAFEKQGWTPKEVINVKPVQKVESLSLNDSPFEDIFVAIEQPEGLLLDVLKPDLGE